MNPEAIKVVPFPQFSVGQIVYHKKLQYRGVIVQVDVRFQGTEEWYEEVALSRPSKEQPWYHVLVHNALHITYVAQAHMLLDVDESPVSHPLIEDYFSHLSDGRYIRLFSETM